MKIAFFEVNFRYKNKIRTHGVDWYRSVNPAFHLRAITDWEIETFKNPFSGNSSFENWDKLTSYFDVGYFPYFDDYIQYCYVAGIAKKNNMKMIIDFDDNVWKTTLRHKAFRQVHPGTKRFHIYHTIAKTAPFLTTTTLALKRELMRISLSKNVSILPNYIDLNIYKNNYPVSRRDDIVTVVYFATLSHQGDINLPGFVKSLIAVAKKYPKVRIKTIGIFSEAFYQAIPRQYVHVKGTYDFYDWIRIWQSEVCSSDISVAPLEISSFSRSKSPIKFFESAAAKLPFVSTDIVPYHGAVEQGKSGFLCKSERDWYNSLESLVMDKKLRQKMGKNAYNYIKNNWTVQKNISKYKDYFERITEKNE